MSIVTTALSFINSPSILLTYVGYLVPQVFRVLGGVGRFIQSRSDNAYKLKMLKVNKDFKAFELYADDVKSARKLDDPYARQTRRIIGFSIIWPIMALFLLGAFLNVPFNIEYEYYQPGFLHIFPGHEVVKWAHLHGIVISRSLEYSLSTVLGLWFGVRRS